MTDLQELPPITPYFLRAFYSWSIDNGFTPQITAVVEEDDYDTLVPRKYVEDDVITLNISPTACEDLNIGNTRITFKARFGGKIESISIPVNRVSAIFIREKGFGLPFEVKRKPKLSKDQPKRGFTKVDM